MVRRLILILTLLMPIVVMGKDQSNQYVFSCKIENIEFPFSVTLIPKEELVIKHPHDPVKWVSQTDWQVVWINRPDRYTVSTNVLNLLTGEIFTSVMDLTRESKNWAGGLYGQCEFPKPNKD